MYYIYRFLNNNQEDIYIGITNDIKRRINQQHFTSVGHLNFECYMETEYVIYSKCFSRDDASIKERYLINKLNPKYNNIYANRSNFNFIIEDFEWIYVPFDKEKFLKSITKNEEKKKNNENIMMDISNVDFINNDIEISLTTKLNNKSIKLIKNKELKFKTVFRYKDRFGIYNINSLKINNDLFFVFNNIDSICRNNAPKTGNIISLLIANGYINHNGIIAVEDESFIKSTIKSHATNSFNGEDLYPKKLYLISENQVLNAYDYIKNYKYIANKEAYIYMNKWIDMNFKIEIKQ